MTLAALVLLAVVAAAAWSWAALRVQPVVARMYQIEEYEAPRLRAWGATRAWLLHGLVLQATLVTVLCAVTGTVAGGRGGRALVAVGLLAAGIGVARRWHWIEAKKELVRTPRMQRILRADTALIVVLAAVSAISTLVAPLVIAGVVDLLLVVSLPALPLLRLPLANQLASPVEQRVRRQFVQQASARLAEWQPLVIGIAGSWGKTTTKHITAHLLSRYGETLPTPKSFNTLMGVTRTVNETLQPGDRTFVVEMDAYGPGEIAGICDLVHPTLAVVTSVGPQHLERFHSVDRIADALYELPAALPAEGALVIHAGEPLCAGLADRAAAEGRRVIRYGADDEMPGPFDVVASDITIDADGAHFRWQWPERDLDHRVDVPLLGRHQVLNVSAALALVAELRLPLEPALAAVRSLQPVEHRLQPLPTGNGVVVIDDSYNANPVGVHNALDVIALMPAQTRVLVTPGLVELGAVEAEENRRYGTHAATVCDHVIVVESRTNTPLREGLAEGGLPADRTHLVRTLDEATAVIGRVTRPGDVVLFANDLPDTYLEG